MDRKGKRIERNLPTISPLPFHRSFRKERKRREMGREGGIVYSSANTSIPSYERFFHESTKCRDFLAIIRRGKKETRREQEVSIEFRDL